MELSYKEMERILNILDCGWRGELYKGSISTIEESTTDYIESDAAQFLCEIAMKNYSSKNPLYVLALGALTNVASALKINPGIKERIIICTLGGLAGLLREDARVVDQHVDPREIGVGLVGKRTNRVERGQVGQSPAPEPAQGSVRRIVAARV